MLQEVTETRKKIEHERSITVVHEKNASNIMQLLEKTKTSPLDS